MKLYGVKDCIVKVGKPNKAYETYYMGKDGYVCTVLGLIEGYKQKRFAEALIEREMNSPHYVRTGKYTAIERGEYIHTYSVVEYDPKDSRIWRKLK